jgi:hypothetical protein
MTVDTIITFIIGGNVAEQIHIVPITTIVGAGAVVSVITSVNTSMKYYLNIAHKYMCEHALTVVGPGHSSDVFARIPVEEIVHMVWTWRLPVLIIEH